MARYSLRSILAERLRRQRLSEPAATESDYIEAFRALQPVSPVAMSYPGNPPRLVHRTRFDDEAEANRLRRDRRLVKGRFLGGTVGYVFADDLALYASAFRRPMSLWTDTQQVLYELLRTSGPLTSRQIKAETGLRNKDIMPVLHRLQEAFLVYEDQVDESWDRGWYHFGQEWPGVDLDRAPWEDAVAEVIRRFLHAHVFATFEQIRDWSRWPAKALSNVLSELERRGAIAPARFDEIGDGWVNPSDATIPDDAPPRSVFMLDQLDMLVRSHVSELKRRFSDRERLQYLLIDGEFRGVVVGHWRIGPHDVEDIVVELPEVETRHRREEIVRAVAEVYHPPNSRIMRYAGEAVESLS